MYNIDFTLEARIDLAELEKSEPKLFAKVNSFVKELKEHPKTGTGHPEPLKGQPEGRWSRRISKKHRLIYRIFETDVLVLVLSSYGHYDDK
ncbi:MAG: Txe/YoeB family addiction module toxin [Paludibacteraceae bacterium]|nr:Txe/YoeB family addiction module toxin [Paludibacteraceae bacterium]